MKKFKNSYDLLSDNDKYSIINDLYTQKGKSFADIAAIYETYPNRIRRDAKRLNIKIRDKSAAQKNALQTGKHKHPTKGQQRSEATKDKIGLSVLKSWEELDEDTRNNRKALAKNNWETLDENVKQNMLKSANNAVRLSSKVGSKLEKFLYTSLIGDGYRVDFHKEQTLVNTKLQIDLFLPTINLAIEVDGPSHFAPVWGEDSLNKNKKYDSKKEGLIFGRGWNLIRVIQTKDFSKARGTLIYQQIIDILTNRSMDLNQGQQKFIIRDTDNG